MFNTKYEVMMELIRRLFGIKSGREIWREENYPVRKLIALIIQDGLEHRADRIALGTPSDGIEVIPTPASSETPQLDPPKRIGVGDVDDCPIPVFQRTSEMEVPLWYQIDSKWVQQEDGFPARLLCEVIRVLEDMFIFDAEKDLARQRRLLIFPEIGLRVHAELWYEEDCRFTIALDAEV